MDNPKSVVQFPGEMLLEVFEHFKHSKRTLRNLCLTCKLFRQYAQPLLYKTVILRVSPAEGVSQKVLQSLTFPGHSGIRYIRNFGAIGDLKAQAVKMSVRRHWKWNGLPKSAGKTFDNALDAMCIFGIYSILRRIPDGQLESLIWYCDIEIKEGPILDELRRVQTPKINLFWASYKYETFFRLLGDEASNIGPNLRSLHLQNFTEQILVDSGIQRDCSQDLGNLESLTLNARVPVANTLLRKLFPSYTSLVSSRGNPSQAVSIKSLRYIDIGRLDDTLRTPEFIVYKFINPQILTTLKLRRGGHNVAGIMKDLASMNLRLTTLHLVKHGRLLEVFNLLASFKGLRELVLDLERLHPDIHLWGAIFYHGQTLERLFWRERSHYLNGVNLPNADVSSLARACPHLVELAICIPTCEGACLRDLESMQRLKLLWIFNAVPKKWSRRIPKPKTVKAEFSDYLQPSGTSKLKYFAIGETEFPHFPHICQIRSNEGEPCFEHISHADLFDNDPDLVLIQSHSDWLPWDAERGFVEPFKS